MNQAYRNGQKLLRGAYTQYTPSGKALFERAGEYHKEPKLGDVVYFYSSRMGRVRHVGAVVSVKKDGTRYTIETVEGNTSESNIFDRNGNGGCVAKKRYNFTLSEVGGAYRINGFGAPAFSEDTCTVDEFVKTLLAEVGYIEKASNKDLESKTANPGTGDYTKYGKWYGGNGLFWCQQFISWCAFKACQNHLESIVKNQWVKQTDGWHYKDDAGKDVKGQWLEIAGRWYAFDEAGRVISKWFKAGDEWYYLNPDDYAMLAGRWVTVDGHSYYLEKTGVMAVSAYVKDDSGMYRWVDESGKWQPDRDTKVLGLDAYDVAE